jgi:hypothetical protein
MSTQLQWAAKVVAAGKPAPDVPMRQRVAAYEELAVAYALLADKALTSGDLDSYLEYSELSEQADATSHQLAVISQRA